MIDETKRAWFEVWGAEMAQNKILKGLLLFLIIVCSLQTLAIVTFSHRKIAIVAVSKTGTQVLYEEPPSSEILQKEIDRVLTAYAQAHLTWDFSHIEKQFELAAKYVHPDYEKDFKRTNVEQVRIAKEKKLSQAFYTSDLHIDQKSSTAILKGDRILSIESLRAANAMTLELRYLMGTRTETNPEGVYVTSEKLIQ